MFFWTSFFSQQMNSTSIGWCTQRCSAVQAGLLPQNVCFALRLSTQPKSASIFSLNFHFLNWKAPARRSAVPTCCRKVLEARCPALSGAGLWNYMNQYLSAPTTADVSTFAHHDCNRSYIGTRITYTDMHRSNVCCARYASQQCVVLKSSNGARLGRQKVG